MSTHLFGVSERQKATSRIPWMLQALGAFVPLTLFVAACIWWNGLLDPHEILKLFVLLIGAAGVAGIHGLYLLQRPEAPRPLPGILLGLMDVVVLVSIFAAFAAPSALLAWFGVGGSVSGSVAATLSASVFLMATASLRVAGWKPSWSVVVGVFLLLVGHATVQRLGWIDLSPGGGAARLFSPLGNEIMVTWFVVLVVAIALAWRDLPWSRWLVVAVGGAWLTWLDRSDAWLVLTLALLAGQLVQAVRRSRRTEESEMIPGRIAIAVAVVLLLVPVPRAAGMPTLVTASWAQSAAVVKVAWSEAMAFGVGQGQWSSLFERIRPVEANLGPLFSLRFDVGANWWFTSAAQEGLLGLTARLLLVGILLLHVARLAIRDGDRVGDVVLAVAAVGVLTLAHPYTWLLIGVFTVLGYAAGDEYDWSPGARRVAGAGMMLAAIALLALLVWQMPRTMADRLARQAFIEARPERRVELLEQAVGLADWVPDYTLLLTQAQAQLIGVQLRDPSTSNEVMQASLAKGIERVKAATERWPTSADMWMARGGLYLAIAPATQGADQFAIQAYQEGMKYAPNHPGFPLGIASVYIQRAEAAAPTGAATSTAKALTDYRLEQRRLAAQWLQRALEKKPDDQGILYVYAANLVRAGDITTALPLFKTLVERQPQRMDLGLEYGTILALSKQYDAAIPFAQRISSQDPLYSASRQLLTEWYAAKNDWVSALSVWKSLPASEQANPAFRTRLRELQSKAGTTGNR